MAVARPPSGLAEQVRRRVDPLQSRTRSRPAPRPFIEEFRAPPPPNRDHVKEACGSRDVTWPHPIEASVYVGTSDSSGLGLRSRVEVAESGTAPGGFAGGPSAAAAPPAPPASLSAHASVSGGLPAPRPASAPGGHAEERMSQRDTLVHLFAGG